MTPTGAPARAKWHGRVNCDTPAGQRLRVAVHARDDYTCQECGWRPHDEQVPEDYDGKRSIGSWRWPADRELHLDHIFPRALGGDAVLENLQTLCEPCNKHKAARI